MKYSIITPSGQNGEAVPATFFERVKAKVSGWRNFALIVVVPTIIFAAYQYLIASDLYETTSEFLVKSGESSQAPVGGFGDVLGIGVRTQSQTEILSVPDYLESHEVLAALQKRVNLVQIFRRPEADIFTRLSESNPDPETLLKYYRTKVEIRHDGDTGIMHISVRTYRPQDSFLIGQLLLALGERKINEMNQRSYDDAIKSARTQLNSAEDEAASIQREITNFRQSNQDVDPELSSAAQIKLVAEMNAQLSRARAQMGTMAGVISSDSPQYQALAAQIHSLETEINSQTSKMGGKKEEISSSLGAYEELKVRQDFAAKNYTAAAANLQRSIEQARKQQLYFIRVVDPNLAVRSLYPKREKAVLTLFLFLTIAYGIGWLILAGVREHEA
jgi:capsular polysaccharide transport system permease protein